jgi:hypothetical protein
MTDGQGMDGPQIRISVTPEPTDEEAAAIAATVTVLLSSQEAEQAPITRAEDPWRKAGRQDALRAGTWPPSTRHGDW